MFDWMVSFSIGMGAPAAPGPQAPPIAVVERAPMVGRGPVASAELFVDALEPYGSWETDPALGRVFIPSYPEYVPYDGRWSQVGSGYRFVSDDPTAWATCHYGSWHFRDRWVWQPSTTYRPGPGADYDRVQRERLRLDRHQHHLGQSERQRLSHHLAALGARERAQLDEHLARRGASPHEIAAERARLARKQALRDGRAFERLDRKQHRRDARGQEHLRWKQELRQNDEGGWY